MWAAWDDPSVEWASFALVVVRSAWDYAERREEFVAWAERVPRLENPLPVIRWSTDKERYLAELAAAGVPTVPTAFVAPGAPLPPLATETAFVVKPAIGAGGRLAARFAAGETAPAAALVRRIHAAGRVAMVQPYVEDEREASLVWIDGRHSHALLRRAPLPAGAAADVLYLEEELAPHEATPAELEVAAAAIELSPAPLVYGRIDLLGGAVLELELAEPSLYLSFGGGAAAALAAAIARRAGG